MGKATRWLKGLFGIKNNNNKDNYHRKNKNRYSSGRDSPGLCYNPATIPPNISPAEAAWIRSYYNETEKEQSKHAIAVAAATAAAADAAVAAAQAAVAVVRLTSQGRGSNTMFGGGQERWAAVKIQTVFRGYLARKALRALKGLVKLQAYFRGYLVRKQATATLHSMQALIRAQATVRSQRTRNLNGADNRFEARARKSMERFDETRSEHTASIHSRRLSSSLDFQATLINSIDGSPKIVEVDTGNNCRPKSRSRRTNTSVSDFSDDPFYQTLPSPLPSRIPPRLSMLDTRNFQDSDWGLTGDECRFSTAQSTPRFINSERLSNPPLTPSKSVCADNLFRQFGNFPNYMANTQSFKAKVRSHSAPKQRPEPGPKKRLSLNELMESRNSISGVRMQRSCSQVQEAINFKNAVLGKLDRCSEFIRAADRNYLQRR
ncbi:hypothetical protein JCGZ_07375 [Jatropha curcas]|uniref:DUF4005 domain-containing protein n=1 Tax=Jatropha curcas TaxID=180498 RepID=A0A067KPS4_JATCU|nr:protein IQ-DOMAIN 14 [Jatropha curcas]KDP33804.1 hypothetical protein JCGZ_07375 [Jatropha curcas]